MSSLRDEYEAIPYPDFVFPLTHPCHLGMFATLFGLTPPSPRNCHILEIGCGSGSNLRNIAPDLPEARLLGIDFAQVHIDMGLQALLQENINNIKLERADMLDYDFKDQQFDYIIAHGFFTWVPDEVKERLFAICQNHLSANGLAYISYNTYPGWRYRETWMELLQLEMASCADKLQRQAAIDRVLSFFEALTPKMSQPHVPLLIEEIKQLRQKHQEVMAHDELGTVNDPCSFLQFMDWASEYALAYVADADMESALPGRVPEPVVRELAKRNMNRLKGEQYLDILGHRRFRQSIFCHANQPCRATPDPLAVQHLWLRSLLKPTERKGAIQHYKTKQGIKIKVKEIYLQKFLNYLYQHREHFVPFTEAYTEATSGQDDKLKTKFGQFVLQCNAKRMMQLSSCERSVFEV